MRKENQVLNLQETIIVKLSQLPIVQQQQVLELVELLASPVNVKEAKALAWTRTLQRAKLGYHLGGQIPSRDSLYER
jgi:hypothetical protein